MRFLNYCFAAVMVLAAVAGAARANSGGGAVWRVAVAAVALAGGGGGARAEGGGGSAVLVTWLAVLAGTRADFNCGAGKFYSDRCSESGDYSNECCICPVVRPRRAAAAD